MTYILLFMFFVSAMCGIVTIYTNDQVIKEYTRAFCLVSAIFLIVFSFVALLDVSAPKDNTDPPNGRSGMKLYTDNLTGCQYLGKNNSLTPRISETGTHYGCGTK